MALAILKEMHLSGLMGDRVHANITQWLLPAPYANPGIFEAYFRRDGDVDSHLSPRDGEYAGKYLVSAILLYRMQKEPRLRAVIEYALFRLYDAQDEDGYLGVFPKAQRIAGATPEGQGVADLWNHYHCMLGLYLWHKTTNSLQAMESLTRAANYVCAYFDQDGHEPIDLAHPELDFAIMHVLALVYRATGDERYFSLWQRMSEAFAHLEGESDFFAMLRDRDFSQLPVNDATLLYAIDSLYTLHYMSGEARYADALYSQHQKLRLSSRLPNGGYGHQGASVTDPYGSWLPETCATAAWTEMCSDTLRAVRKVAIADELELTAFNASLGALHPSGRYMMCDAPMTGHKHPARVRDGCRPLAGAPEFNCCAADGTRALGMIGQWGVFADEEEIYLNYYGACSILLQLTCGRTVHITQTTNYPQSGKITLTVTAQRPVTLHLRIPRWSRNNVLTVEGVMCYDTECGTYYPIHVTGTIQIELELDMGLHYWAGEEEALGRHALYRGPLLLAFDKHFNPRLSGSEMPVLEYGDMHYDLVPSDDYYAPMVLCRFTARDGSTVYLTDYASSGHYGTPIQCWLPIRRAPSGSVWK